MLKRRPWGPLCWVLAFFTASYQQRLWSPNYIGVPKAPLSRVWLSLPHLIKNSLSSSTGAATWLLSWLSYIIVQRPHRSPTRSLEWHDWSLSSGNNCHAVHRSLSSGASVYESIMGFFSLSHFVSQFSPTWFPLLTAIRMCQFLPVYHLEWHFGPGRRSKYNKNAMSYIE